MAGDKTRRLLAIGGWFSLVVGLGFLAYSAYALAVGRVVVASRAAGETTIAASSGWPFALGILIYLLGALGFLWIARVLLKSSP